MPFVVNIKYRPFCSACCLQKKRSDLQMWKADSVPTFEMWARELGNMLHLEELRFILKDKLTIFLVDGGRGVLI